MSYQQKYLKYKIKYLALKGGLSQMGGECKPVPLPNDNDPISKQNLLKKYKPYERITINGKCYSIIDLYKWIFALKNDKDPFDIVISDEDKKKIRAAHEYLIQLQAVKQDGLSLNIASNRFKDDFKIVLAAVKQNGLALQFASDKLKDNYDIVLATIRQNEEALQFASDRLKNDKDALLAAIQKDTESEKVKNTDSEKVDKDTVTEKVPNDANSETASE